ncbi:MAG: SUMF1/EgtB/PvdO family nonheme iron enzyme [Planctomycetota bacterium]
MAGNVSDEAFARAAQQGGVVSYDDVEAARAAQAESAKKGVAVSLAELLVRQGVITVKTRENIEKKALAQQAGGLMQLGPYKLIRKLGEGGMGAVYLADDLNVGRKVAVKVLPKKNASDPDFLTRFRREAKAAGALNHVNIVGAYNTGEDLGFHYLAMEYCEGAPLDKVLKRDGRLPWDKALEIIVQVAHGLKHAHDHGFIHRDIKPANIMLCNASGSAGVPPAGAGKMPALPEGFVAKILDLGLSKNVGAGEQSFVTQTNVALGTPHYISPEQATGDKNIDGRTDIYSLGVTFYHLVTGQTPFQGSTSAIILGQHISQKLPNPQALNPEIPDGVVCVIQKMMAKKPSDRYGGCQKLLDDLEMVREGQMPSQAAVPLRPVTTRQQAPAARRATKRQAAVQAEAGGAAPLSGKRNVYLAAGIGALILLALVIGLVFSGSRSSEQQAAVRAAEDKRKAEADKTEQKRKAEASRLKDEAARLQEEWRKLSDTKRKAEETRFEVEKRKLAEERRKLEEARVAAEAEAKAKKKPETAVTKVEPAPVQPETKAVQPAVGNVSAVSAVSAEYSLAKEEKAQQLFSAVLKETAPLLAQNKLSEAIAVLERKAKDPALADAAELLKQEQADVAAVVGLRRQAIEALRKLAGQQVALRKGGTAFKGKVVGGTGVPPVGHGQDALATVTLDAGGAQMPFSALMLSPEDVDQYAPVGQSSGLPTQPGGLRHEDLRRRGLLFLYAGDTAKAKEYFTKAAAHFAKLRETGLRDQDQQFGKVLDNDLDRLTALELGEPEMAALKAWNIAEKLFAAHAIESAKAAYEAFQREHGRSQTAAKQTALLRERYTAIAKALGPPKQLALDLGGGVKLELVLVKAGEFVMGCDNEKPEEKPAHKVKISKPFYIAKYKTTVAQFRAFAETANYRTQAEQDGNKGWIWEGNVHKEAAGINWKMPGFPQEDNHPVCVVSWDDVQEFCKWAATKTGRTVGLPTEAQWEYACRAGTTTSFNTGDADSDLDQAAWLDRNSDNHTHPVGQKKPNAWGLYDMHGNLFEWCQDWRQNDYYKESPAADPPGPALGKERMARGGSWGSPSAGCRSSARIASASPAFRCPNSGFRVVVLDVAWTDALLQPAAPIQKPETAAPASQTALDLGGGVKMELVPVQAGEFMMGSDNEQPEEKPAHKVQIGKPFYIAKYKTTVAQFRMFAEAAKYQTLAEQDGNKGHSWGPEGRLKEVAGVNWKMPGFPQEDSHPVCLVAWDDAREFCKWAARKTGRAVALPTEAQWEYACRAGTTTRFNTGDKDSDLEQAAWFDGNSDHRTHLVGEKKPNAWGLYDMHGNVCEWCEDCYQKDYYKESPAADPPGPLPGEQRVLRGGSCNFPPWFCRSGHRAAASPVIRTPDIGFRVVVVGAVGTP